MATPNLLPRTKEDNPFCRPICINESDLVYTNDFNGDSWLAMQDALDLREWR